MPSLSYIPIIYLPTHLTRQPGAYRATVPYLLEQQAGRDCTWTTCTGTQGTTGERALPAISQGALFSMATAACRALAGTHVRFNEVYLDRRTELDDVAALHGNMKASVFARVYEKILARPDLKGSRVLVFGEEDVDTIRSEQK